MTTIRATPATTAGVAIWISTDGKEPLPEGTNSPTEGIAVACSPTSSPGRGSAVHDARLTISSLNARPSASVSAASPRLRTSSTMVAIEARRPSFTPS